MPAQRRIIHYALPDCVISIEDIQLTIFLTKGCMYLEGSHKVRLTVDEAANCEIRRGDSTEAIHVDASHTARFINPVLTGVLNDT